MIEASLSIQQCLTLGSGVLWMAVVIGRLRVFPRVTKVLPAFVCAVIPLAAFGAPSAYARNPGGSDRVASSAAFDRLARTEGAGRFIELPRIMFAIDRNAKPERVHWIDTGRYEFHFDYLRSRYLTLADEDAFTAANYSKNDRRFVLGAVVRYPRSGRYGVELWEGDVVTPELVTAMMRQLQSAFYAPLTFKPNSDSQRLAAEQASLPVIGIDEAYGARTQLVLNRGRAVGRLVLVGESEEGDLLPGDIALLTTIPIRLLPVAGIVSTTFSTPINHVSLLAKSWGIPNVYSASANSRWAALRGQQVVLDATGASVVLRLASIKDAAAAERARSGRSVRAPFADVVYNGLPSLAEQDADWSGRTGTKAANLARVAALARAASGSGFVVPPGFSVPFSFYDRYVAANGLKGDIDALLANHRRGEPTWRRGALAALRDRFAAGVVPAADMVAIAARRADLLGSNGVFVRSSTNAEDLPGFNGAGLYDTVPNVLRNDSLAAALKTIWGSIWNDRAFAAREKAGIDHRAVRAAVLIQSGVDADAAGVMTTVDPFDERSDEQRLFIAAKRGIGIRVVEGRKVAEQIIYRPRLDSIQVLTRSRDDVMLRFAPDGGVEELKVEPDRAVLSDDLVRRLGSIGLSIQDRFGDRPQDIEWLVSGGRIMIVQSRDYVRGS